VSATFDGLLALLVLALALRMLTVRELFQAVVLFVAFGLALAMVWVRAGAIDIALAEVALGAGVTGALLVNTLRRLQLKAPAFLEILPRPPVTAVLPVACGMLAASAALAALLVTPARQPLAPLVLRAVERTDVTNPVTAVLLDFRAWDTLLEIAVLLAGVLAVWALERGRPAVPAPADLRREPVLAALIRWIVPLAIVTSIYLTWYGSYGPGGAFQAGALLAGAGVLMLAGGFLQPRGARSVALRCIAAAGLFVFTAVALYTTVFIGAVLRYPPASYYWILGIEAVLTLSIAAILADLFADVPAAPGPTA
jgi:multisubunit Na+/H+ antiporter MnhB subunit